MKIKQHIILFVFAVLSSFHLFAQLDSTWVKTYGGDRDDKSYDMISTRDGGFLLIGSTSSFGFDNSQMYFLKLDSMGEIMWSKSHGGPGQESGHSVIQTADGGYFGVGHTNSWGAGGFDMFFVKLDSNGNLQYEDYYGGSDWDFAWDVVETSPQKYAIVGETQSFGNGAKDGWILKYDGAQNTVDWEMTLGEDKDDYFKAIAMDLQGNLLAAGGGTQLNRSDEDVFVVKLNPYGDTIWTKYYGDTLRDYANDITVLNDTNFGLTGVKSISTDTTLINILSINQDGEILFTDQWGVGFLSSWGTKIMGIDSHRIAVLGVYQYDDSNFDFSFGYSFPSGGYFEKGGTLGSYDKEISASGVHLKNKGYLFTGTTKGYGNNFTSIINFKTDRYGRLQNPNSYDNIKDTINITTITNSESSELEIIYNYWTHSISCKGINSDTEIRLIDINGRQILLENINNTKDIDLNNYMIPKGLYILKYYNHSHQKNVSRVIVI